MKDIIVFTLVVLGGLCLATVKADTLFNSGEPVEVGMSYSINWSQAWGIASGINIPAGGRKITGMSRKLASASSTVSMGVVLRIYADKVVSGKHYPDATKVLSSTPVQVSGTAGAWYSTGPLDVVLPAGYAWFGLEWTSGASGVTGWNCPNGTELEAGVYLYNPPNNPDHLWGPGNIYQNYKWTLRIEGQAAPLPPVVCTIAVAGPNVNLTWAPVPGAASYDVYQSSTLAPTGWTLKQNVTGATSWTGAKDGPKSFYRVFAK